MQAPKFWYRSRSWQAVLLSPFGALYAWATARRQKNARPTRVGIPVICIGNLNVGGTGKTPTTIALAQLLSARGIGVHIVSRGYGGSLLAVTQVDPRIHTADETGDEPLLMAASITNVPAQSPLMIRLRRGKCPGNGGTEGGNSDRSTPEFEISRLNFR